MTFWLIYDKEGAARNREYINFHMDEAKKKNINCILRLADEIHFPPRTRPDFAIVRTMNPPLSKALEREGIRVFNSSFVSEICNDKAKTYEYLCAHNIPVIPWSTVRNGVFPCDITYPSVIKPTCGHGGQDVFLVNNESEAHIAINKILPQDFVIQRAADTIGRDLRVYVLGKTPVAAVMRTAKGDFRSNFSLGGSVARHTLTNDEEALVNRVCEVFDFGLVGVDIMYDGGRAVINEIEDVVGSRMLYATHDINIVSMYLDFILEKI